MGFVGGQKSVAVARAAMATRFELVLHGSSETTLRAAGEAALDEIERLEAQLSFYRPSSEISHLNARAAAEAVRVEPQLFELLARAQSIHRLTEGAFDPTIGPLMRCWGFAGGIGRVPESSQLEAARRVTGMHLVHLDRANFSVRFECPGVQLDLGAIGKGYAIERAADVLTDSGIGNAIIHGGTSTVYAMGKPPGADAWKVAVPRPMPGGKEIGLSASTAGETPESPLAVVALCDQAVSVSAIWGRAFAVEGKVYGHVLDPRLGEPVTGAELAVVTGLSAADADAYSTALLVLGAWGVEHLRRAVPELGLAVAERERGTDVLRISARGVSVLEGRS